jgi:hypothetical protein
MVNYNKSVIYKIVTGTDIYIGSTVNFRNRKYLHKSCIYIENKKSNTNLYKTIRKNDYQWQMLPIKEYPCESKLQLILEEQRCAVEYQATLNMKCCGTGLTIQEYHKKYHIENREKTKEYRETNKENKKKYDKEYYKLNKQKKKEYRETNKEIIKQKQKEYYQRKKNL